MTDMKFFTSFRKRMESSAMHCFLLYRFAEGPKARLANFPSIRSDGERVSGKEHFVYFDALVKVNRGVLPVQHIKSNIQYYKLARKRDSTYFKRKGKSTRHGAKHH